jgi:hypothetical protein
MNRNLGIVFALLGALLLAGCQSKSMTGNSTPAGTVVASISDASADLGSVTNIWVTVDAVYLQSSTEGWVKISSESRQYDLMALKTSGKAFILGSANVTPGSYNMIRMDISKVTVVDANGSHDAKLPSGQYQIKTKFDVDENKTSTVNFDIMANESLHMTGNGLYILTPVVTLETQSDADVEVNSDNSVNVKKGKSMEKIKVGMDVDGKVDVNVHVPANVTIDIDEGNHIVIKNNTLKVTGNSNNGVDIKT